MLIVGIDRLEERVDPANLRELFKHQGSFEILFVHVYDLLMDIEKWNEVYGQLAKLEKQGKQDWKQNLFFLLQLTEADLPDLERAVAWMNCATAYDRLGNEPEALRCLDQAVALEEPHRRFTAIERKAVFLANHGKVAESLKLFQVLAQRKDLYISDVDRIQKTIGLLEKT